MVDYYDAELAAGGWEVPAASREPPQATFHAIRDKSRFQTVAIQAGEQTTIAISFGDVPSQRN